MGLLSSILNLGMAALKKGGGLAMKHPKTTAALAAIPAVGAALSPGTPPANAHLKSTVPPGSFIGANQRDALSRFLDPAMNAHAYDALQQAQGILGQYHNAIGIGTQAQQMALEAFKQDRANAASARNAGQLYLMAPGKWQADLAGAENPFLKALTALPSASKSVTQAAIAPTAANTDHMNALSRMLQATGNMIPGSGSEGVNYAVNSYMPPANAHPLFAGAMPQYSQYAMPHPAQQYAMPHPAQQYAIPNPNSAGY